ncbi:hypothetical protein ACFQZX_00070 [Mucilaginibacter litoreus]|uniref:HTH cro/C1-type domain-containing protein n=1 Tax=Mucilaginibacter litoreus TaxID=1048221 RepID=A0ABW3AMH2_9SPHI
MSTHYGQIVERAVRRNCYSITELAALTKVNRRSVYNWFNQKQLSPTIIYRIGKALNHDFSVEMPELFSPDDFKTCNTLSVNRQKLTKVDDAENGIDWKNKYICLLEEFEELLSSELIKQKAKKT